MILEIKKPKIRPIHSHKNEIIFANGGINTDKTPSAAAM